MSDNEKLKLLRTALAWSYLETGRHLGLTGRASEIRDRVFDMEAGTRAITGPLAKVISLTAEKHNINLEG